MHSFDNSIISMLTAVGPFTLLLLLLCGCGAAVATTSSSTTASSSEATTTAAAAAAVCHATKRMYIDRACCGRSGNATTAMCTAPNVDFSSLPVLKEDVHQLLTIVEDVQMKEHEAEERELRMEHQLLNVTAAQEKEDLRFQTLINDMLESKVREDAISRTTSAIDNKATELQTATNRSIHAVSVDHSLFLQDDALDMLRYLHVKTSYGSTQRLRVLGSEVFANQTVKVSVRNPESPCVPRHYYVHNDSSVTTTPHKTITMSGNRRLLSTTEKYAMSVPKEVLFRQNSGMTVWNKLIALTKPIQILVLGLDGAGKTAMLYGLKLAVLQTTSPASGGPHTRARVHCCYELNYPHHH